MKKQVFFCCWGKSPSRSTIKHIDSRGTLDPQIGARNLNWVINALKDIILIPDEKKDAKHICIVSRSGLNPRIFDY